MTIGVGVAHRQVAPRGRFVLAETIDFGFGARRAAPGEAVLPMAFVLDGYHAQVGVMVSQDPKGTLHLEVAGTEDVALVVAQVARVLSLDVDASGWDELGNADALIGRLQAARPGLRPPLFYSAYEATAWAILSARRRRQQSFALRERLAAADGATFTVAGHTMHAFPTPEQLLKVESFPGLAQITLDRLHALAKFALDGHADTAGLKALDPADAAHRLRTLDGIGAFYAALVVIRALGHTDVLPADEPVVLGVLGALLGRIGPSTQAQFEQLAQHWSPWRTWAAVAIRASGARLLRLPSKP